MENAYHYLGRPISEVEDDEKESFLRHAEREYSAWIKPSITNIALSFPNLIVLVASAILFVITSRLREPSHAASNPVFRRVSTYSRLLHDKMPSYVSQKDYSTAIQALCMIVSTLRCILYKSTAPCSCRQWPPLQGDAQQRI